MPLYERVIRRLGSGDFIKGRAGQNLGRCQLVYKHANGAWYKADADLAATMPTIGITLDRNITAGQIVRVLTDGYVGANTWTWTPGGEIYASTVAGVLTQTAPVPPDLTQFVAMAISPTMIYFRSIPPSEGLARFLKDDYFPPMNPNTNIGDFAATLLTDGADIMVRTNVLLPRHYNANWGIDALVVPAGTGNMRRGVDTDFFQVCANEAYNANTGTIAAGEVAVVLNRGECIDITAAFTGATVRDLVGVEFTRYGSHGNDTVGANCYFLGVIVRRP